MYVLPLIHIFVFYYIIKFLITSLNISPVFHLLELHYVTLHPPPDGCCLPTPNSGTFYPLRLPGHRACSTYGGRPTGVDVLVTYVDLSVQNLCRSFEKRAKRVFYIFTLDIGTLDRFRKLYILFDNFSNIQLNVMCFVFTSVYIKAFMFLKAFKVSII